MTAEELEMEMERVEAELNLAARLEALAWAAWQRTQEERRQVLERRTRLKGALADLAATPLARLEAADGPRA